MGEVTRAGPGKFALSAYEKHDFSFNDLISDRTSRVPPFLQESPDDTH